MVQKWVRPKNGVIDFHNIEINNDDKNWITR